MKYLTADVLAGSRISDEKAKDEIRKTISNLEDRRAELYGEWREDEPKVEQITNALLKRIQNGDDLTVDELQFAFKKPSEGYANRYYGLRSRDIDGITKHIEKQRQRLLEMRPSPFTVFLESVGDEYITDYGLKSAGFSNCAPGRLAAMAYDAAA